MRPRAIRDSRTCWEAGWRERGNATREVMGIEPGKSRMEMESSSKPKALPSWEMLRKEIWSAKGP